MADEKQTTLWQCAVCSETVDAGFRVCWNCGADCDGAADPHFERADGTVEESRRISWAALPLVLLSLILAALISLTVETLWISVRLLLLGVAAALSGCMVRWLMEQKGSRSTAAGRHGAEQQPSSLRCGPTFSSLVCPSCLESVAERNHFCVACGCPVDSFATTAPLERVYSVGWMYRRAVRGRVPPIGFVGMWLVLGPWALSGAWFLTAPTAGRIEALVGFIACAGLPGVMLLKMTQNYLQTPSTDIDGGTGEPSVES